MLRQVTMGGLAAAPRRGGIFPSNAGSTQDMGGRVTRYPLRGTEKTQAGRHRDIQLGERWMDAMSVDYSCLFPTGMLTLGLHPQKEMEADLCWAYNRWLTEKVLPESDGRFFSIAEPAVLRSGRIAATGRDLRRPQGRRRLHGHDRAPPAGQRQLPT